MKIRFFSSSRLQRRKKDAVISFITNALGSAYTLPTPQNSRLDQAWRLGDRKEVKAP